MDLKTYVRCIDPSCGWDGEDWDTVEVPVGTAMIGNTRFAKSHREGCPECRGEVVPGSWCISCGEVPVDDPGCEECDACLTANEAAFNERVQKIQAAVRTFHAYRAVRKDPAKAEAASQLRMELRGLLEMDGVA